MQLICAMPAVAVLLYDLRRQLNNLPKAYPIYIGTQARFSFQIEVRVLSDKSDHGTSEVAECALPFGGLTRLTRF